MVCDSIVIYKNARQKGSGKPYQGVKETYSPAHTGPGIPSRDELLARGGVVCKGKINATVSAEDEPYFGGSSATLTVTYDCDTCGQTYWGAALPSAYNIDEFLTEAIAKL